MVAAENYRQAFDQAAATGVVLDSVGEGRVASAPRMEYAGRVLELSGDTAWTFDELAATFADVLGRDVVRRGLTAADHREALLGLGLDHGTAGFVVALDQNIAEGLLAVTTGELATVLGRPTAPLADTVRTWA